MRHDPLEIKHETWKHGTWHMKHEPWAHDEPYDTWYVKKLWDRKHETWAVRRGPYDVRHEPWKLGEREPWDIKHESWVMIHEPRGTSYVSWLNSHVSNLLGSWLMFMPHVSCTPPPWGHVSYLMRQETGNMSHEAWGMIQETKDERSRVSRLMPHVFSCLVSQVLVSHVSCMSHASYIKRETWDVRHETWDMKREA